MLNHKLEFFFILGFLVSLISSFAYFGSIYNPFDPFLFSLFLKNFLMSFVVICFVLLIIYMILKSTIKASGKNYVAIYKINNSIKTKHGFMEGSMFAQRDNNNKIEIISDEDLKLKVEKLLIQQGASDIHVYTSKEWNDINNNISKLKSNLVNKKCANCGSTEFIQVADGAKCVYCKTIYK